MMSKLVNNIAVRRTTSPKRITAASLTSSNYSFDTTNPEALEFTQSNLHIIVLGGITFSGLERLKVTLKISNSNNHYHPVRQHLDLYHSEQVQRLTEWCNSRLELGSTLLENALQNLTDALENYRLEKMNAQHVTPAALTVLSEQEKEEALSYLRDENLMQNTFDDLGKTGIVGEEDNRMIMFLVFLSRILVEPLHIISFGASGSGKTYLQEKIARLLPPESKIEITAFSANSLYYFKSAELQHKVLLIEDLDGAQQALYPLRELQSKQKLNKVISLKDSKGEIKKQSYTAESAVCVAGCTTKESIYEDNANRSILIYIDNSEKQDERIIAYQQQLSAGTINLFEEEKWKKLFINIQRLVVTHKVYNPYATMLQVPSLVFKKRRANAMYLKFIEVVTLYNQFRKSSKSDDAIAKSEKDYLETTIEDIEWANKLLKRVFLNKSDDLANATRNILEKIKKHLKAKKELTFTTRDLKTDLRMGESLLKKHLPKLVNQGYLKIKGGNKLQGYCYLILDEQEYIELKSGVFYELDQTVEKLKKKLIVT
jgi:DNA primase